MKPGHLILAAAVLVLACGTAIRQQRTLVGLKGETRSLGISLAQRQSTLPAGPLIGEEHSPVKAPGTAMLEEAKEAFLAILRSEYSDPDLQDRLNRATSALDARTLAGIIEGLKNHGEWDSDYEKSCALKLIDEQAEKVVQMVEIMPRLASNGDILGSVLPAAFRSWMLKDPAAAIRWFDEEGRKGNPRISDPVLQQTAAQALFHIDPDRGLALMLSARSGDWDDEKIDGLARVTAETLIGEREHATYLAALRRASEKSPGNALLERMRDSYLEQLPERLGNWIFEDASAFLDAELNSAQRFTTARNLALDSSLEEPEKWMNWFTKIDGNFDPEHPARIFLNSWLCQDYAAVGRWLDQYPAGRAKNDLVGNYARQILRADPAAAARHLATLPDNPERQALAKRIMLVWQAKDPDAAAAFAQENGL